MLIICISTKFHTNCLRFFNESVILDDIKMSLQLMADFPDYFGGYDLVGQEDPGLPLIDYLDALRYPSTLNPPVNLPYFFHAGETSNNILNVGLTLVKLTVHSGR